MVFLPSALRDMTSAQVAECAQNAATFASEDKEQPSVAAITQALQMARGDSGFRDSSSSRNVGAVHVLVPEAMPELDYCRWSGDGHYDMSHFPGQQPPTLAQVVCFLRLLDVIAAKGASVTLVLCSPPKRPTLSVLAGSVLVLQRGFDSEAAWEELQRGGPPLSPSPEKAWDRFPGPFSRTGVATKSSLRVCDCLAGLLAAKELGWMDSYQTFDVAAWSLLRRKFDASWLIPGEVLALANPWGTSRNPAFPGLLTSDLSMAPTTSSGPGEFLGPRLSETRGADTSAASTASTIGTVSRSTVGGLTKAVSFQNFFGRGPKALLRETSPASEWSDEKEFPVRRASSDNALSQQSTIPRVPSTNTTASDSLADVMIEENHLEHSGNLLSPKSITGFEDWDTAEAWISEELEKGVDIQAAAREARLYARTACDGARHEAVSPIVGPKQHYRCPQRSSPPMRPTGDVEAADVDCMEQRRHELPSPRGDVASPESLLINKENFVSYFNRKGISLVTRLNHAHECPEQQTYVDVLSTVAVDIKVIAFPDGDIPPKSVVRSFISLCRKLQQRQPDKCVAVHCMGGLGRTGALVGAFAVSKYGIEGKAFHGWTRICRPGTVQTEKQEAFLRSLRRKTPIFKTASLGITKMMSRMSIVKNGVTRSGDSEERECHSPPKSGEEQLVLQVFMAEGGVAEL